MMNEINYRLAKPTDAKDIARLHHATKSSHEVGFFTQMRKSFLKRYYKIILNDPYSVVIAAENENGKLVGFCSSSMKYESELSTLKKHKLSLAISMIPSFICKPKMIVEAFRRLKSTKGDVGYIVNNGPRGEYWVWDASVKDSIASIRMNEKQFQVLRVLGVDKLHFEVDGNNIQVLKFSKQNGAVSERRIALADGREREIMYYDLTKKRRFTF